MFSTIGHRFKALNTSLQACPNTVFFLILLGFSRTRPLENSISVQRMAEPIHLYNHLFTYETDFYSQKLYGTSLQCPVFSYSSLMHTQIIFVSSLSFQYHFRPLISLFSTLQQQHASLPQCLCTMLPFLQKKKNASFYFCLLLSFGTHCKHYLSPDQLTFPSQFFKLLYFSVHFLQRFLPQLLTIQMNDDLISVFAFHYAVGSMKTGTTSGGPGWLSG